MRPIQRRVRIEYLRAHLRRIDEELNGMVGILMPKDGPDDLRLRSLHQEQDRYEEELRQLGVEP